MDLGIRRAESFSNSQRVINLRFCSCSFDPKRPVILACDASPYGIGAVLSHRKDDGTDQPIAFASHTLRSCSQEKVFSN